MVMTSARRAQGMKTSKRSAPGQKETARSESWRSELTDKIYNFFLFVNLDARKSTNVP